MTKDLITKLKSALYTKLNYCKVKQLFEILLDFFICSEKWMKTKVNKKVKCKATQYRKWK